MDPAAPPDIAALPIPEKERYTYADYAELPEGAPYELIKGTLVMAPSPSAEHQRVLRRLAWSIQQHLDTQDQSVSGELFFASLDVFLTDDTIVQPDLIYIASTRDDIISDQHVAGALDLVVEIFSPSTAHRDVGVKKRLYEQHGVREYWTLDPSTQSVEVHANTESGFVQQARVVETGMVSSTVVPEFELEVGPLFSS